jgi:pimeloyl-ACP methyl ester carboxylesterase
MYVTSAVTGTKHIRVPLDGRLRDGVDDAVSDRCRCLARRDAEVGAAKLVRIPDAAIFVPFDRPDRVAAKIADFAPSP